jgi:hypothetical protein
MPRPNVQVQRGGFRMDSRPAQLQIDQYAARSSMGLGHYNPIDFMRDEVQRAWQLAREGVERSVENGNALARGSSPAEVAVQNRRGNFNIETFVDFIPKTGPEFSVVDGMLEIDISPNRVNIEWEHIQAERAIYHPGSVDVVVTQYPEIQIEFVGPIQYFPPSANPDYVPQLNVAV